MQIISQINNRELSILIWFVIFLIWCLTQKNIRQSGYSLIKAFFNIKFVYAYIFMLLYIIIIILPFYFIGIWGVFWLKNTILWIICVAYVMLFKFSSATDTDFIRNSIKDNLKILVVLEFIINLYVFNLFSELLLVPFTVLIGGMIAVAESDIKYKAVQKFLNIILSMMGFVFLAYAIFQISNDLNGFLSKNNLVDLVLPICLTIMFLPFIYFIALYANYEKLFLRLRYFIKDKDVLSYSKRKIIYEFNFNLRELNNWGKYYNYSHINTKKDIDDSILNFKMN